MGSCAAALFVIGASQVSNGQEEYDQICTASDLYRLHRSVCAILVQFQLLEMLSRPAGRFLAKCSGYIPT